MRDLIKKVGRFCENHVEKIVFVAVGLVCTWLFFTRVIFSPNVVSVGDKTFSPGQIDTYVKEKADELERVLDPGSGPETPVVRYTSRLRGRIDPNDPVIAGVIDRPLPEGFLGLLDSPLGFLGAGMKLPMPGPSDGRKGDRRYALPRIPDVTNAAANHIRAAAYFPLQEVTPDKTYNDVEVEPNDIDLVTVEAQVDAAELYRQFNAYFAGEEVQKEQWRDPCLADPVFAASQLQRQQLLADGTWSAWGDVPRSRIEAYGGLFKVIERVEDLPPGGVTFRRMQFDRETITMDLLQPEAYQIASAEEDWLPPSFYSKYKTLQKKVQMEERRQEREDERKQQDSQGGRRRDTTRAGGLGGTTGRMRGRDTTGTTGTTADTMYGNRDRRSRGTRSRSNTPPGYGADYGADRGTRGRTSNRRGRTTDESMYPDMGALYGQDVDMRRMVSTDEAFFEFAGELITWDTDLSKRDKPLLFWAFDDTAAPGGTYRYRIRLGVFNPVAGTDQLVERDLDKKDQVILWSNFSNVTEPVAIPEMLYFFAKDVKGRTKTATVEVARYALGYWRSEEFEVKAGEVIGKEMEPKVEEKRSPSMMLPGRITDPAYAAYGMGMDATRGMGMRYGTSGRPDGVMVPETIDYRTGKVLVDLVEVNDWGSAPNLRPRMYHDMLYTGDGANLEHMAVSTTNWPKDLLMAYNYVKGEARKEPQPFRDFKKGGIRSRARPGMPEGYDGMESLYDEMYMMGGQGLY